MTPRATIILATQDTDHAAALGRAFPFVHVMPITSDPPTEPLPGKVHCFVDWLLPDFSGLEMCRRLRQSPATATSHITMVLDEDDADARRRALRSGADDYLLGPLTEARLAARLDQPALIIAPAATDQNGRSIKLRHGDLVVDLSAHQLRHNGRVIPLRPNEFRLLVQLVENPDRLFTRAQLIELLGKDCAMIDDRTVDVWVGRLRRALRAHGAPDPLRTVRSLGYVFDSLASPLDASAA